MKKQHPAEDLRALMKANSLTQAEIATLAGVTKKCVERWLADPEAASHSNMPARHLTTIGATLPRYLAARSRKAK